MRGKVVGAGFVAVVVVREKRGCRGVGYLSCGSPDGCTTKRRFGAHPRDPMCSYVKMAPRKGCQTTKLL